MWVNAMNIDKTVLHDPQIGPNSITLISNAANQHVSHTLVLPNVHARNEFESQLAAQIRCTENTHAVYGVDLSELLMRENSPSGIPQIIEDLVHAMLPHIHTEGLFRIGGAKQDVDRLHDAIDSGSWKPGEAVDTYGIHTVASAFKLFFNELPQPLIPYTLYGRLMSLAENKAASIPQKQSTLNEILSCLPTPHRNLEKFLVSFLATVVTRASASCIK
ncbi:RhoGAP domain [Pelomyxa schiedti]|nr:RhoGAP domain [Pelomyxa schiedti]